MNKMYITKSNLQKLLSQYSEQCLDYPKPILTLLTAILVILFISIALVIMFIIILAVILYAILGWIDILIGKYILKRIFK